MSKRRGVVGSKLVEPYKQVKLGLIIVFLNCAFAVLICSVLAYFLYDVYTSIGAYFELSQQQNIMTLEKFSVPLAICIGLGLVFIAITMYVTISQTHKIYGPLVSIHRYLDVLLQNKKPHPLQLRESDQVKELADKLNLLSDRFLHNRPQISQSVRAIEHYIDALHKKSTLPPLQIPVDDPLHDIAEKLQHLSK